MKKRILAAASVLLIITAFLAGCSAENSAATETETQGNTAPTDTVVPDTSAPTEILASELGEYTIVRPGSGSLELGFAAADMRSAIVRSGCPAPASVKDTDTDMPERYDPEKEIIIYPADRSECEGFADDLLADDWKYVMSGRKIIIGGGTEEATIEAVRAFTMKITENLSGDGVFYASGDDRVSRAEYPVKKLIAGGIPVEGFRIVYPAALGNAGESICAALADAVRYRCGSVLEITDDASSPEPAAHEILIGMTSRGSGDVSNPGEGVCVCSFDGKDIRILGTDLRAVSHSVSVLAAAVADTAADGADIAEYLPDPYGIGKDELGAMSFNVLCGDFTGERVSRVIHMITSYLPDTVGLQEATEEWMKTLENTLSGEYGIIGEGRDGGNRGEANPVLYRKTVFDLIDSGTRWLSDTPERPSKYGESSLNRIYTYALLERKSDGRRVLAVNTHLDHASQAARNRQARVLADFLSLHEDVPVILTGDFNTAMASECFLTIQNTAVKSTSGLAQTAEMHDTFTNFGRTGMVIDFIFVDPAYMDVGRYRVCSEKILGDWPSDHHPVYISYTLKDGKS